MEATWQIFGNWNFEHVAMFSFQWRMTKGDEGEEAIELLQKSAEEIKFCIVSDVSKSCVTFMFPILYCANSL